MLHDLAEEAVIMRSAIRNILCLCATRSVLLSGRMSAATARMMSPSRFWMSIAAVVATQMSLPAEAAMFRVAPVTLDLQSGNQAGVLTLTNLSNAPITIQLRPFRWSQTNGTDVLEPAE